VNFSFSIDTLSYGRLLFAAYSSIKEWENKGGP